MVFALQQRKHRVVGTAEADVSLLGENRDAGEKPFGLFGGEVVGRIVHQVDVHLQIGALKTAKRFGQLISAMIQHQAGGQD